MPAAGNGVPLVLPDDLITGLVADRIDFHALDGARRGPHPESDLRPFEGRPRRAGGRKQAVLVAEVDLAVGADIDNQLDLVAVVRFLRQQHRHVVRADEACLHGQ